MKKTDQQTISEIKKEISKSNENLDEDELARIFRSEFPSEGPKYKRVELSNQLEQSSTFTEDELKQIEDDYRQENSKKSLYIEPEKIEESDEIEFEFPTTGGSQDITINENLPDSKEIKSTDKFIEKPKEDKNISTLKGRKTGLTEKNAVKELLDRAPDEVLYREKNKLELARQSLDSTLHRLDERPYGLDTVNPHPVHTTTFRDDARKLVTTRRVLQRQDRAVLLKSLEGNSKYYFKQERHLCPKNDKIHLHTIDFVINDRYHMHCTVCGASETMSSEEWKSYSAGLYIRYRNHGKKPYLTVELMEKVESHQRDKEAKERRRIKLDQIRKLRALEKEKNRIAREKKLKEMEQKQQELQPKKRRYVRRK